jgi:hypothetical protein
MRHHVAQVILTMLLLQNAKKSDTVSSVRMVEGEHRNLTEREGSDSLAQLLRPKATQVNKLRSLLLAKMKKDVGCH